MAKNKSQLAIEIAKSVALSTIPGFALATEIAGIVGAAVQSSEDVAKSGELEAMRLEAERQEFSMAMAERQSRVMQELAISARIETAEEVEIEERYDYSGNVHAGLSADAQTGQARLGIGGAGKRVSRRIYRFKGRSIPLIGENDGPRDPK